MSVANLSDQNFKVPTSAASKTTATTLIPEIWRAEKFKIKSWVTPTLFFVYFRLLNRFWQIKNCRWMDCFCECLMSKATALWTVPQRLSRISKSFLNFLGDCFVGNISPKRRRRRWCRGNDPERDFTWPSFTRWITHSPTYLRRYWVRLGTHAVNLFRSNFSIKCRIVLAFDNGILCRISYAFWHFGAYIVLTSKYLVRALLLRLLSFVKMPPTMLETFLN